MKEAIRNIIFRLARTSKKYKQSKLYILFIVITLLIAFAILITTSIKFVWSNFFILSLKMAIVGQYIPYIITNILVQVNQTQPIKIAFRKYFSRFDNIYDVILTIIYSILCNIVYMAGDHLTIQQKLFMSAMNTLIVCLIIVKWVKIFFKAICQRVDEKYIAERNADYRSFASNSAYNRDRDRDYREKDMVVDMDANGERQQGRYRELNQEVQVEIQPRQKTRNQDRISSTQPKTIKNKDRKQNKNIIKLIQMASLPKNYLQNKKYDDLIQDRNDKDKDKDNDNKSDNNDNDNDNDNKVQELQNNQSKTQIKRKSSLNNQQKFDDFSKFDGL